ncbi:hypothetical protein ACA910_000403 [Epithemia clementina (nom. ined.)]
MKVPKLFFAAALGFSSLSREALAFLPLHARTCPTCQTLRPDLFPIALRVSVKDTLEPDEDEQKAESKHLTEDDLKFVKGLAASLATLKSISEVKDVVFAQKDADVEVTSQENVVQTDTAQHAKNTVPTAIAAATQGEPNEKSLLTDLAAFFSKVSTILNGLDKVYTGNDKPMGYSVYPKHEEYPDISLEPLMKMLNGPPPREYIFSRTKFKRAIRRAVRILLGLALTDKKVQNAKTYEEKFKSFFTKKKSFYFFPNPLDLVPEPPVLNIYERDEEFSRQFLCGVNPVMIEVIREPKKQMTPELHGALEASYKLKSLADAGELFKVDYEWLSDLPKNPHQAYPLPYNKDSPQDDPRYYQQAPQVILMKDGSNGGVKVLAVQLDRKEGTTNRVYMPKRDDMDWTYAKACVTNCDSQFHEWVSHLGKTHLTMEPHIIAMHNVLRLKNHKLFTFFKPMMKDTLFLNWAARQTLAEFGPDSFGDHQSSVGVGQFMQLIMRYWKSYDFFKSSALPDELESRGFDSSVDLEGYYFRTDGMELWNAYGTFAKNFLDEIYTDDAAVASDPILQEWSDETRAESKGRIKGFPEKFEDKATLVKTMQTLWWICSGLHAAVNFPQYDYYSFAPNKPLNMRAGLDQYYNNKTDMTVSNIREWMFEYAMPSMKDQKQSLTTVNVLTLPSLQTINKLDDNFSTIGSKSYALFKSELEVIGKKINERNGKNQALGIPVYHYLHPDCVPASIDI